MTLADLRKIAEAATPGEWEAVTDGKPDFYGLPEWRIGNPAYPPVTRAGMTRESAEFIATFNPSKVLELLAHLTKHEQAVENMSTKTDDLLSKLAAVEKLHQERPNSVSALHPTPLCSCDKEYPCPTIKAVRGE